MKTKTPEIIEKEFNNAKNGIDYKDVPKDDKTNYNWKCSDCEEIWDTTNYQRIHAKKGNCSYCTGQKVRRENSLGFIYPELIEEWSSENQKTIYDYSTTNNTKKHKWTCKECQKHYEQRITSRIKASGCDCTKSTLAKYPHLAKEIQNADPTKITIGTHDEYEWKCQDCEHTWKEEVNKRVNGNSKCPKCNKTKAIVGNTLADTHRQLMDEWDFEKNTISPFSITSRNSSERINWKCEKHPNYHKWDTKLESRVSKKPTGCPYCSGNKTSKQESIISDNVNYRDELLIKEFDETKNTIKIEEVRAKSSINIYWKCSNEGCNNSWRATPANRTGVNETGCPQCSNKLNEKGQSNAEKKLRQELKIIFNSIEETPKFTGFHFPKGKEITIDFFISELHLAFDLDPLHTHKKESSQISDKNKTEILKNYCNFFKLREYPLEKTSENDIIYYCATNNSKELAKLIYLKILEIYPKIDNDIKEKLLQITR